MSVAEMKRSIIEKVETLDDKDVEVFSYLLSRMNVGEKAPEKSIQEIWEKAKANYGPLLEKLAQ